MTRPFLAAAKSTSARDLAIQMLMGGFSGIPITERDGAVVGLVSELDIIRALRAGKSLDNVPAAEIMTAGGGGGGGGGRPPRGGGRGWSQISCASAGARGRPRVYARRFRARSICRS